MANWQGIAIRSLAAEASGNFQLTSSNAAEASPSSLSVCGSCTTPSSVLPCTRCSRSSVSEGCDRSSNSNEVGSSPDFNSSLQDSTTQLSVNPYKSTAGLAQRPGRLLPPQPRLPLPPMHVSSSTKCTAWPHGQAALTPRPLQSDSPWSQKCSHECCMQLHLQVPLVAPQGRQHRQPQTQGATTAS